MNYLEQEDLSSGLCSIIVNNIVEVFVGIMPCEETLSNINGLEVSIIRKPGRFIEEDNYEVILTYKGISKRLLVMKIFHGRPPYYRRWIEVFAINASLRWSDFEFRFVNSEYEDRLLECLSSILGPGEWLYIEYLYDEETMRELERGSPPEQTRLGSKLIRMGFTWFKNWYYPEGFMEGGPKLQAEKASNRR
ncbi:MAG: DUF1122 family protein [Thermosphaera sp.]